MTYKLSLLLNVPSQEEEYMSISYIHMSKRLNWHPHHKLFLKHKLSSSSNYSPSMELIFDEVEGFLALMSGDLFITFSLANFPIKLVTLRLLLGKCFSSFSWSWLIAHHKWLVNYINPSAQASKGNHHSKEIIQITKVLYRWTKFIQYEL